MSGIVLSSSVRQNLLSLQSTADLLATTQAALRPARRSIPRSTIPPTSSPRSRSTPRQRHQQPARRHRQRRAGAAGRQHRHHLAAEAGRYREVGRQPGAADRGRLFDEVLRLRYDRRRHRARPARHHDLHQRHRDQQRHHHGAAGGTTAITSAITLAAFPLRWSALPRRRRRLHGSHRRHRPARHRCGDRNGLVGNAQPPMVRP